MEGTFKIIAIYKSDNAIKLIIQNGNSFYESIIKNEKIGDYVIINKNVLTEERKVTDEEVNKILHVAVAALEELFETEIDMLTIEFLDGYKVQRYSTEHYKPEDIMNWRNKFDKFLPEIIYNIDTAPEIEKISLKQDYSHVLDEFIEEYEDAYLLSKRFYKKQRTDFIPWDEYFMAIAKLSSMRSKDPNTQVGACIVAEDNRILSIGYNGAPLGINDDYFPWERSGNDKHTKYMSVCHAELNAILNYNGSRKDFKGATIYVDLFPCNECAKLIIQSGIKHVVYLSDKYANTDSTIISKKLLTDAGVTFEQLRSEYHNEITLSLKPNN